MKNKYHQTLNLAIQPNILQVTCFLTSQTESFINQDKKKTHLEGREMNSSHLGLAVDIRTVAIGNIQPLHLNYTYIDIILM